MNGESSFEITTTTDYQPSCWRCRRTLAAYLTRPWSQRCHRCKAENRSPGPHPDDPLHARLLTEHESAG